MTHNEVFETFDMYFPQISKDVTEYFSNGKSSVRVRRPNARDLVFTFEKDGVWSLETVDHFAERLRGRTKM